MIRCEWRNGVIIRCEGSGLEGCQEPDAGSQHSSANRTTPRSTDRVVGDCSHKEAAEAQHGTCGGEKERLAR